MDPEFARAKAALQEMDKLIKAEAEAKESGKKTRERMGKILKGIGQVIAVVEPIAALNTQAQLAVSAFKTLIGFEEARRENNEQIIVVYCNMSRVFYTLVTLRAAISDIHDSDGDEERSEPLREAISDLHKDIKEFGSFADVFYNKYKSRIVRFIHASDLREKLKGFITSFENRRQQLQLILAAQTAANVEHMREEMHNDAQTILASQELVLNRLGEIATKGEKAAAAKVTELGGVEEVMNNPKGIEEIAIALAEGSSKREPITTATLAILSTSLDDLLEQNRLSFEDKLDSAQQTILDSIAEARKALMEQLKGESYKLLEDPDIKVVWEENHWNLGVKCRQFVEAVYTHFDTKFRREALTVDANKEVEDAWTLSVLSRVINHPAIGEAIDEDASGFLSIQEVNNFLKKKPLQYTTPQWLVFWAIGWRYKNSWYTVEINATLDHIKKRCKALIVSHASADALKQSISQYLDAISLVRKLNGWSNYADGDEAGILADCDDNASTRVVELADEISAETEGKLKRLLDECNYDLNGGIQLQLIVDHHLGGRLEQVFVPMLHITLLHDHDTIAKAGETSISENVEDINAAFVEMHETLIELVFAFHSRMQSLLRAWRSQKLDGELQVQCYAGGLMYAWYRKVQEEPYNFEEVFYEDDNDDDEEEDDAGTKTDGGDEDSSEDEDEDDDIPISLSASVSQLHRKVKNLERNLEEMKTMMQQFFKVNAASGHVGADTALETD